MADTPKAAEAPAPAPASESPSAPSAAAAQPSAPAGELTRRDFLAGAGTIAALGCGAAALAGSVRFAVPETTEGAGTRFPLGLPSDFKARTVTWLRDRSLFVLRDEKGFGAFSSKCTHLGCTVQRTAAGFSCPCHGAKYDEQGRVASGPARRALPWFAIWQEPDGRIWVDLSKEAPAGTAFLVPPGGAKEGT